MADKSLFEYLYQEWRDLRCQFPWQLTYDERSTGIILQVHLPVPQEVAQTSHLRDGLNQQSDQFAYLSLSFRFGYYSKDISLQPGIFILAPNLDNGTYSGDYVQVLLKWIRYTLRQAEQQLRDLGQADRVGLDLTWPEAAVKEDIAKRRAVNRYGNKERYSLEVY
ncbi:MULTISPECIES: hypothetical protein [Aerococcus]|uniref:Uncharacterized protein n=1 Tax=Aerococcus sanguinicola TaxID=119206 RepID=A0A5N1GNC6_9LACT|nr:MULTISPECIES: hypothetical protein [Aerococcus]KAA9301826.1 hypothetical protein F6I03_01085 [Aerococcus sanguinicola]MDK6368753.1 hypothetical protein [Aerococcus sp. UMB9870]MDK6679301.1 hypothetical protein [Aerococcus sp. UMB8608]MDK6685857.1 hypothetical protein [Aerococcus sp. UMB8623]MDK6939376.1 hypothetical protein [Aerococcus sp. UMB8487]